MAFLKELSDSLGLDELESLRDNYRRKRNYYEGIRTRLLDASRKISNVKDDQAVAKSAYESASEIKEDWKGESRESFDKIYKELLQAVDHHEDIVDTLHDAINIEAADARSEYNIITGFLSEISARIKNLLN